MSISTVIDRSNNRMEAMRAVAAETARKSVAASPAALYGGTNGAFGSPFDMDMSASGNATNQLRAYRDVVFAAVRPIAVKIADLSVRAGYQDKKPRLDTEAERFKNWSDWQKNLVHSLEVKAWAKRCERRESSQWHSDILDLAPKSIKAMTKQVRLAEDHPAIELVDSPNEYLSGWDLKYLTAVSLCLTGKALWWVETTKESRQIWFIPMSWATPKSGNGRPIDRWIVRPPGTSQQLEPIPFEETAYFFFPSAENPFVSHSWAQANARSIDTDDRIQQANASSMQNVINPQVILTAGRLPSPMGSGQGDRPTLTPEQRRDLIGAIKNAYAGAEKYGEPAIIDGLIEDIRPFRPTPSELDYLNSSEATKRRIMEGFGVSPIVAGQSQNANRAGSAIAHRIFIENTVNPIATKMGWAIQKSMRRLYVSDMPLLMWLEIAKVNDEEMIMRRAALARPVMTKGELREYAATGELNLPKRDDDDEPAMAPPQPKGESQGGGKKPPKPAEGE